MGAQLALASECKDERGAARTGRGARISDPAACQLIDEGSDQDVGVEAGRQDVGVSETVVMLHGFGGTARHWDRLAVLLDRERYSPLALELADARPLSLAGALDMVGAVGAARFTLCGYSMGGRIALHAVATMPERVSRLVLISTSAGIEDEEVRLARASSDEALARKIELGSIEDFVLMWRATPLFASDPEWVQDAVAEDERRLSPEQVAATLRAYGAGRLPPLWRDLSGIETPVVVLAGERDTAYCELGARLAQALPRAELRIVRGAGHRVALEAPEAVLAALRPSRAAKS
jgi:2-succinyl-6-hydroxy-2,4-cyclohexadiene-1-carboxylate synthase